MVERIHSMVQQRRQQQQRRRRVSFSFQSTFMFWAALVVLSLVSLSLSPPRYTTFTTVQAMTFSNPRTRGAQVRAQASAAAAESNSNSNDMTNDNDNDLDQQQRRRRRQRNRHNRKAASIQKKKDYSYENCPWSADQTIEHHLYRIFERPSQQQQQQIPTAYQTQAQRRQIKAQKAQKKAVSYPALTVLFPHIPPHLSKHGNGNRRHRQQQDANSRHLEDQAAATDDAYVAATDDAYVAATDDAAAAATDDYYQGDDDATSSTTATDDQSTYDDDIFTGDNEMCSQFLVNFLEGTTDARDTCEGIQNAYVAADCQDLDYTTQDDGSFSDDNYDDYFEEFSEHVCCSALMAHHSDYCEENSMLSNFHLFVASFVLLLCECAKAVVQHYQFKFLPEAATCILVGTLVGAILSHLPVLPGNSLDDDLSFDDELFLTLLLPPIIFEAALSVSKKEFKRRRGAIFMFSVVGTIICTFSTGIMVHYSSKFLSHVTTFPMLDSLVFGALISSIDPVAILSVLTSLNLNQKDTIFILVFGESLLNDGIAITVFQTLVARFDGKTNDGSTSMDEIYDAAATFLISMFGSIAVGLLCGCGALLYFVVLRKQLAPVMEVGSFFLWAVIPYYICDGVGWSGIVSIVAVAFFMDIYIAGPKLRRGNAVAGAAGVGVGGQCLATSIDSDSPSERVVRFPIQQGNGGGGGGGGGVSAVMSPVTVGSPTGAYVHMNEDGSGGHSGAVANKTPGQATESERSIGPLPSTERITLSPTADKHVRFVAHLTSQLAENAIFAYLGLFLFSSNYDWNLTMMTIAIVSCVLSRAFMVFLVSRVILQLYKCRNMSGHPTSSRTAAAIRDKRTQTVLVLAGLRGAVSLALVENVPIYNSMTGEGCEFKPLMKGMTSAAILFTTFIFGGGAFYILPHLGITPEPKPLFSPHIFKGGGSELS